MLDRLYLIKLIDQLRNFEGSEEDEDLFLEKLVNLVTDPNISDYIYWTNMSSEEIADKVLSYKPIMLPDLSNSKSTWNFQFSCNVYVEYIHVLCVINNLRRNVDYLTKL